MRKGFFYAMVALLMLVLTGCSDDDGLGASELCHAWYWRDEMPKNYYDLIVYKNNGTIDVCAMINTEDGLRKKVVNHGRYTLNGDRLTCWLDGAEESFTYRIVIEKTISMPAMMMANRGITPITPHGSLTTPIAIPQYI